MEEHTVEMAIILDINVLHPERLIWSSAQAPRMEIFPPQLALRLQLNRYLPCPWRVDFQADQDFLWVPYSQELSADQDIHTYGSYIVGPRRLFHIPFHPNSDVLSDWLDEFAGTRFLVTSPVFHNKARTQAWASRIQHTMKLIRLAPDTPVSLSTLESMLSSQCYLVLNGLIYALALVRAGLIDPRVFREALNASHIVAGDEPFTTMPQYNLDEFWNETYMNHPSIPHLAEVPAYYALRTDREIAEILMVRGGLCDNDEPMLTQTVTMAANFTTHPLHATVPFAKPTDFKKYLPHYGALQIDLPDFISYVENICSSKASWEWFVRGGAKIFFESIQSRLMSQTIMGWLTAAFTLFKFGGTRTRVRRSRIVRFWKAVIHHYHTDDTLRAVITQIMVRALFNGHHAHPPILFVKWLFVQSEYAKNISFTEKNRISVNVHHSAGVANIYVPSRFFRETFRDGFSHRGFSANISLNQIWQLFEEDPTSELYHFVRWLNKMRTTRLLTIKQHFGLGSFPSESSDMYQVGTMLMYYLERNPDEVARFYS